MADLSTHYKEITPLQTVQNVINFFEGENIKLVLSSPPDQSEAGTWYCHVDAYKGKIKLGGANGKGMTKEYALASGYAELYERFCNQIWFISSPFWTAQYMNRSKKEKGYYFHAGEQVQSYEEMYHCCRRATEYIDNFSQGNKEIEKAMIELMMGNKYIGVPLQNIENAADKIYLDPRLMMRILRSNGMAAGNTINEALVQGLSEVVEREACFHLFQNPDEVHYALDLNNIQNPALQEKIKAIHDEGYEFYLFDLSYNYSLPVIMSLLVERDYGVLNVNFGSFPVFDIAAERVITELYQGIKSYKDVQFKNRLQQPYKSLTYEELAIEYGNAITGEIFPASFFSHIRTIEDYNHKVFIDKNKSNEELVQYFCDLANNIGCKFYYINNSLSKDIAAVYIMMESTDLYHAYGICRSIPMTWNPLSIEIALEEVNKYKRFYKDILSDRPVDLNNLIMLYNNLFKLDFNVGKFLSNIVLWHGAFATYLPSGSFNLLQSLIEPYNDTLWVPFELTNHECVEEYKKYIQLILYIRTNKYNYEELIDIFNNIFNYQITEEDMNKCMSPAYLLQRAYIEPLRKFIHSNDYYEIMDTYINNLPS